MMQNRRKGKEDKKINAKSNLISFFAWDLEILEGKKVEKKHFLRNINKNNIDNEKFRNHTKKCRRDEKIWNICNKRIWILVRKSLAKKSTFLTLKYSFPILVVLTALLLFVFFWPLILSYSKFFHNKHSRSGNPLIRYCW